MSQEPDLVQADPAAHLRAACLRPTPPMLFAGGTLGRRRGNCSRPEMHPKPVRMLTTSALACDTLRKYTIVTGLLIAVTM